MELPRFLCAVKPSEAGLHGPRHGDHRKEVWNCRCPGVCLEVVDGEEEETRGGAAAWRAGSAGSGDFFPCRDSARKL
jgi:hypothetical protein